MFREQPPWTIDTDRNGMEILSPTDCLSLLSTVRVGRVAVTDRAIPVILPVNFVLLPEGVVFATGVGTKLAAATARSVVAFEADEIDPRTRSGWSVCVTGRTEAVLEREVLERARDAGLDPMVSSSLCRHVRVGLDVVTGRRVRPVAPTTEP